MQDMPNFYMVSRITACVEQTLEEGGFANAQQAKIRRDNDV